MPIGYTCPHPIVGQNFSRLCLSALMIDQMPVGYTCPHAVVGQTASRLYLSALMIGQMPVGYTCPHAIVVQNANRLYLSAPDSRTKFQSVMLVTHDRPNASRLYLCAHDSQTNCQFFYGEPHNAFLDLIFPMTVDRTCIIYGDNAVL
jgi:hypothetical protein